MMMIDFDVEHPRLHWFVIDEGRGVRWKQKMKNQDEEIWKKWERLNPMQRARIKTIQKEIEDMLDDFRLSL